jgi:pyruvate formate lyase activating enzyme
MTAKLIKEKCRECNICRNLVNCPAGNVKAAIETGICMGCGACAIACPEEALVLEKSMEEKIKVYVDNKEILASGTVKNAMNAAGITITKFPNFKQKEKYLFSPCNCGRRLSFLRRASCVGNVTSMKITKPRSRK